MIGAQSANRQSQSAIGNLNPQSAISIRNRQSQYAIGNLNQQSAISIPNRQSKNAQSPIRNPQSFNARGA